MFASQQEPCCSSFRSQVPLLVVALVTGEWVAARCGVYRLLRPKEGVSPVFFTVKPISGVQYYLEPGKCPCARTADGILMRGLTARIESGISQGALTLSVHVHLLIAPRSSTRFGVFRSVASTFGVVRMRWVTHRFPMVFGDVPAHEVLPVSGSSSPPSCLELPCRLLRSADRSNVAIYRRARVMNSQMPMSCVYAQTWHGRCKPLLSRERNKHKGYPCAAEGRRIWR